MSLNWLHNLMKSFKEEADQTAKPFRPFPSDRVLFVGFGAYPGFASFQWDDQEWTNAGDFQVAFVNAYSLYEYIAQLKGLDHAQDDTREKLLPSLSANLSRLSTQLLEVINTGRPVIAIGGPDIHLSLRSTRGPYASTYAWCPLPVSQDEANGDASIDRDVRFRPYRALLKNWNYYFSDKPQTLEWMDRSDLAPNQRYVLWVDHLFDNLSLQPLGIGLQYGIVEQTPAGSARVTETISGPIYLLHNPEPEAIAEGLASLLKELCARELPVTQAPPWAAQVVPPRGPELDGQIQSLSERIAALSVERDRLQAERRTHERWSALLYGTGNRLEDIVLEALGTLGLSDPRKGISGDHDIIGTIDDGLVIFEVKGLVGPAGRKDVFDLDRHIAEFQAKNKPEAISKGVLVVNGFRDLPPGDRDQQSRQVFAGDAIAHARILQFALLDTRTLFDAIVRHVEGHHAESSSFLRRLVATVGPFRA